MKSQNNKVKQFAVIGLGRFGQSIVRSLSEYGVNILAVDNDEENLHAVCGYATHMVKADAEDEEAMAKLGLGNFDTVIMAMGEDLEASLLATMTAKELGAKFIVVKSYGQRQKKIFESVGADLVVVPEQEMGAKLAHRLVRPNIVDILEDNDRFQITEMRPLPEWVGKSVVESDIRKEHHTSLLAIIRDGNTIFPVLPEEVIRENDLLIALCGTASCPLP